MNSRQALVNSFGVNIGNFQINCILEKQDLKISVSCLIGDQLKTKLAMSRMTAEQESLNFWVSAVSIENSCPWKDTQEEREKEKSIEKFMLQKIAELQSNFQTLKSRLSGPAPPEISKRANFSDEEFPLQAMIIKDEKEIGKLQNLNNILQEKLVEKQVRIISLQKKLYEQDELVHELAEKLMVANTDKDDIFNQYEKILQSTVFRSKGEEELAEFIASMDGQERMGLTQSMKGVILKVKEQVEGAEEEGKQKGQEHVEIKSSSSHSSISPKENEDKPAHSSEAPLSQ